MDIQTQGRLSDVNVLQHKLEESQAEARALRELASSLCSPFRTMFGNLTSRDFYGRLHGNTDGCTLCGAEATQEENGLKKFTHKDDCALVVLDYVEPGQVTTVDW